MTLATRFANADPLAGRLPDPPPPPRFDPALALETPRSRPRVRRRGRALALVAAAVAALAIVALELPAGHGSSTLARLDFGPSNAYATLSHRLDAAGHSDWSVERGANHSLAITCSGCDAAQARPIATTLARPGVLGVYDWETSVLGRDCHAHPGDAAVTGGPEAGLAGPAALTRGAAQARAKRCGNAIAVRGSGGSASSYYPAYYVLEKRPSLTNRDIADATATRDTGTRAPTVTITFSSTGRKRMRTLTRAMADRMPGATFGTAPHFAIVLDGVLLSVPYVDTAANPRGIDAGSGTEIAGGMTIGSARALAAVISSGQIGPATP